MNKKLIALFVLIASVFGASAQQYTTLGKALTPGTNSVYGLPARVISLNLLSTYAGSVSFYDNATNKISYTNAAYTTYINVATNYTQLYTNTQGIIQTNYYEGNVRAAVSVAAATNTLPALQTVYYEAGVPVSLPVSWLATHGISANTSTNVSVSITYGPIP